MVLKLGAFLEEELDEESDVVFFVSYSCQRIT